MGEWTGALPGTTEERRQRTSARIRRRNEPETETEEDESSKSSDASYTDTESQSDSDSASSESEHRRVRFRFSTVFAPSPSDFAAHIFNLVHANLAGAADSPTSPEPMHFATFTINISNGEISNLDVLLNAVFDDLMGQAGQAQPRGLDEEKIGALPRGKADEKHKDCAICREDFPSGSEEDLAQLPACGHVFHRECIGSWLKRVPTCPICRKSVE